MIIKKSIFKYNVNFELYGISDAKELIYFDIETTGFSAKNSDLYMIGLAYFNDNCFEILQAFVEDYMDEETVLKWFLDIIVKYKVIVNFNGNTFDIPFIKEKYNQYYIPCDYLKNIISFDIYRKITKYKHFLGLDSIKQKDIEVYLGIQRDDVMSGGELIKVYKDYIKEKSDNKLELLFLHNLDDIKGLIQISDILYFTELFKQNFDNISYSINEYTSVTSEKSYELIIDFSLKYPLPKEISFSHENYNIKLCQDKGYISVKAFYDELKYFFKDYKNYYYLPDEDMAVHKSVATYVDKNHRKNASAATCYTKKSDWYIPTFGCSFEKTFKKELSEKNNFIMIKDNSLSDNNIISNYILCLLNSLI